MALPVLDLSHYTAGSAIQRAKFTHDLVKSFQGTGFVKLVSHGFSGEEVDNLFAKSKLLFDLSPDLKENFAHPPGPEPQRGWTGVGVEVTGKLSKDEKIRALVDEKEHFDQGPPSDAEFPNRWPNEGEVPGFRSLMECWYDDCDKVCMEIVKALEDGLDVPRGTIMELCKDGETELRLNHFPAVQIDRLRKGNLTRISPHTDFGIVTLLFQDSVGGLEIEDRRGKGNFLEVSPGTLEMIVNVSDTLQRWTNDKLMAGVHRVTVPGHMKEQHGVFLPERFTMAYFFKAKRQVLVGSLPEFLGKDDPPKYQRITALEYQKLKNRTLYT